MKKVTQDPVAYYNKNADSLIVQYEQITFETAHDYLINYLPSLPAYILDVGAGSGRDAAGLSRLGYTVWAVEPSSAMIALAKRLHEEDEISWETDSLPELNKIVKRNLFFDFILVSAVWIHLSPQERSLSICALARLLNPKGRLAVTIRNEPFDDDRVMYLEDSDQTILDAKKNGLTLISNSLLNDKLNRANVSWRCLIFQKD